jgi:hypothetical protein
MTAIAFPESGARVNVPGDLGIAPVFNCWGFASWGLWQIYMNQHKVKLGNLGADRSRYVSCPVEPPTKLISSM